MDITRADLRRITYAEFGEMVEALTDAVRAACEKENIRIETVAPILRSGGMTGCHLASRLGVTSIIPVCYQHTYNPDHPIRRGFEMPDLPDARLEPAGIVLVDTNTVTGSVATHAALEIRKRWPSSTIVFASLYLDASIDTLPNIDFIISLQRTNERRTMSHAQALELGATEDIIIFPWEDLEEQWDAIQAAHVTHTP